MQPLRPHGQSAPPLRTTMWPISPAPPRPRPPRPAGMTPPRAAVPQNTPSTELYGRAAPSSNSAPVATETSLPSRTSLTPSALRRASATRTGPSKPVRFAALAIVPAASSTSPGAPPPTPASSGGAISACAPASRCAAASASRIESGPPSCGVGWRAWPRTWWRASTTIACTFVPPRSIPPRSLDTARRLEISSGPGATGPARVVREMSDGCEVDQVLMVREAELRRRRDGAEYLRLSLGDRTGAVAAVVWDGVPDCAPHARAGAAVRVAGRFSLHPRYGAQITVRALGAAAEGS